MSRSRIIKRYLSPFFGTDRHGGSIRPPFVWATLFCMLAAISAGIQIAAGVVALADGRQVALEGTIATLAGLSAAMVAVYNQGRKVTAQADPGRMSFPPGSTASQSVHEDIPEGPAEATVDGFIQPKRGGEL